MRRVASIAGEDNFI